MTRKGQILITKYLPEDFTYANTGSVNIFSEYKRIKIGYGWFKTPL